MLILNIKDKRSRIKTTVILGAFYIIIASIWSVLYLSLSDLLFPGLMSTNLKYVGGISLYLLMIIGVNEKVLKKLNKDNQCRASHLKDLQNKVNYLGAYDSLTDLSNRNDMEENFNKLLGEMNKKENPIALLYIDIDDFAYVNETNGHHAGDRLLIEIANIIKLHAKEGDLVSRISQDKFAIVFTQENSYKNIEMRIKEILKATRIQWEYEGGQYMISTTIGVSVYPDTSMDFVSLLKHANFALECAKENSRASYEYYSPDVKCTAINDLSIISDIKTALESKLFHMHYQPISDLETGEIVNVESLIRWFHPKKGYISPAYFIPIAEKAGMIDEIGDYTIDQVFSQKQMWNMAGYKLEKISINISAMTFAKENFSANIVKKLDQYNLKGSEVVLELTETSFSTHANKLKKSIDRVRALGIEVAMDDFGTGYSSLARLKDLQIDHLKLDRAFIVSLLEENGQEIIKPLISLAKALGKSVIAEGIETQEQFDILKSLGCKYGQGYYLARPMSASDLTNL